MAREVGAILKLDIKDASNKIKTLENELKKNLKTKVKLEADLSKMNKLKSDLDNINNRIKAINNRKISLQADYQSYQQLQKQLKDIEREIVEIGRKKLNVDINNEELQQLNSRLKELKQQKAEIKLRISDLKNAFTETNKLNTELNKLNAKKVDIETKLNGYQDTQSKLDKTRETIGRLEANKVDLDMQLNGYNTVMQQLNSIDNKVKNLKQVGSTMNSMGKGMTNLFSGVSNNPIGKFGHFLVQAVGYSSLYRLTSGFMNSIETSFAKGIQRMDTLANANRTFKAMDFDDSVIQSSMDELESRILGLPTTLDDAMQSVTMISAINKDLPYSVRLFDAINNSILAFGGNAEKSKRAITQFSQAMGTGKLDARTYLSLTDAGMSPALAKVAEMLGYASGEMNKFKSDLGQGIIPLEEFTDALITLNENGYDTMRALNSLAKENAVKSIGSAITVYQTQIAKGWEALIQSLNDSLVDLGYGSIAQNIAKLGNFIREKMIGVSNFLKQNKEALGQGIEYLIDKFNQFKQMISGFDFNSFVDGLESFKWVLDGLKSGAEWLFNSGKGLLNFLGGGDSSKGLGRLVAGWFSFGYAMRFVGSSLKMLASPMGIFSKFMTMLGKGGKKTSFMDKFASFFGKGTKGVSQGTKGLQTTTTFDKGAFLNSMGNFAKMGAVAGEIMLFAESIKQLDEKVPNNLSNVAKKLGTLTGVVVGMEAVVIAMGKVVESKFVGSAQVTGLINMLGVGGVMWVMAEAIGNFDKKVPSDIGNFASKMANFAIAIGGFETVLLAMGILAMAGGGLGALVTLIGGVFTMGLAGTMAIVGECIESFADSMVQVAKSVDKFSKVKINKAKVNKNIGSVLEALEELGGYSNGIFDAIGKLAEMKINEGNFAQASSNLKEMEKLSKFMEKIGDTYINPTKMKGKFTSIKASLEELSKIYPLPTFSTNVQNVSNIAKHLENIYKLTSSIEKINTKDLRDLETDKLVTNVKKVSEVVKALQEIELPYVTGSMKSNLNVDNIANLDGVITGLMNMIPKFNQLSKVLADNKIEEKTLIDQLNKFTQFIWKLNNVNLGNALKAFPKVEDITNMVNSLEQMKSLVIKLQELDKIISDDETDYEAFLEKFRKTASTISTMAWNEDLKVDQEQLDAITNTIDTIKSVMTKLSEIQSMQIDFESINAMITKVGSVITNIKNITGADQAQSIVAQIETLLAKFKELITTLTGLSSQFQEVGTTWGTSLYTGFEESDPSGKMVEYVNGIIDSLLGIDMTSVGTKYGNDIYNGFSQSVAKLPSALSTAISNLYSYGRSFASAGASLGGSFANAFNNAVANLKAPSIPSVPSGSNKPLKKANGGLVEYFSKGGNVFSNFFKPKGTDTIPAMLTRGEYVVRKQAVDSIGVRFLDKINSMDFKGAFNDLMSSHSSYSIAQNKNTTINNYTYNYDNRKVSVSGGNERQQVLRAGRFLRGMA